MNLALYSFHHMGKFSSHYTDEELEVIKKQWLKDKAQIDQGMSGSYHRDIDIAHIKCLANKNLQMLFRHVVHLYWGGLVEGEFRLYEDEKTLVARVYQEIKRYGYYDRSKEKEKRDRTRLGKAVRRQTYEKRWRR